LGTELENSHPPSCHGLAGVFFRAEGLNDKAMKNQKAKGKRQKAKVKNFLFPYFGRRRSSVFLPFAFCLLPFAFAFVQAQTPSIAQLAQEAGRAMAEQRYADAAQTYEKLRQLSPNVAEIHAQLGMAYFQLGHFAQAVPSFQQAIKLKPALPNLDAMLAMSQNELGQFKSAAPVLHKSFKRTTDAVLKRSLGLQLQRAYTGLQQDDKAVEVALELVRLYPQDAEVLYQAGKLFGNFAYLNTVKLAEVAPDSVWLHLAAGEANEAQNQFDVALSEYRAAVAIAPNKTGLHFRIGRVLLARARQDTADTISEPEALKAFEQELALDATNANAAYEAAEIHRKSARFEQAAALFTQAAAHYADFEEALVGLGRALLSLGKANQALAPLQRAIKLNANDEVAWFQLAQTQRALGNAAEQQKALAEFQRLRDAKTQKAANAKRREVTQQELDPKPPQE
jgi:tetratricopeptide (TPR) repeat protein